MRSSDWSSDVCSSDLVERGFSDRLPAEPWQTCTCIGDWHYNRARFEQKSYVPAEQVIQRLCDVVSKNGNMLLSIPVRGAGPIDCEEEKIFGGITHWLVRNGDENGRAASRERACGPVSK